MSLKREQKDFCKNSNESVLLYTSFDNMSMATEDELKLQHAKIFMGVCNMRYFLVILIIVILMGLFFISLDNIVDFGISSLVLAGISSFALFRVLKYLFEGSDSKQSDATDGSSCGGSVNPLDYIIFGEIADENEADQWKE